MTHELSPQTEQYLASVVAGGLFPTKEAALEAAVDALRAANETIPMVPDDHMKLVEQGMASALAGQSRDLTESDWHSIKQRVQERASGNQPGRH